MRNVSTKEMRVIDGGAKYRCSKCKKQGTYKPTIAQNAIGCRGRVQEWRKHRFLFWTWYQWDNVGYY